MRTHFIKIITLIYILLTAANTMSQNILQRDTALHCGKIEVLRFASQNFSVTGNLYLPVEVQSNYPAVIWVSGSGPSYKTITNKETVKLVNCFLDAGFAYFRMDKPGYGDSEGEINDDSTFAKLSDVTVEAVNTLMNHPRIDANKIGLFGSSQAGYIMPLAVSKCGDIKFMIGSSCPAENSIEQWNYLLEKQMMCEGTDPIRAKLNAEKFLVLRTTEDKNEFDDAVEYFRKNPMIVRSLGYDSSFAEKARDWWPRKIDKKDEMHFDPSSMIPEIRIPVYMVYGRNDKQIDPVQAAATYSSLLSEAGNDSCEIITLENCDHNMSLSSGCMNEISELNKKKEYFYDPEYLQLIEKWITRLKVILR